MWILHDISYTDMVKNRKELTIFQFQFFELFSTAIKNNTSVLLYIFFRAFDYW